MTHRQYTIVVEHAEGSYSAYAPDLPGVVAAGDTVEETERFRTHIGCPHRRAVRLILYVRPRHS